MKYVFFLLISGFAFGQVDSILLNNPKTRTVPFWDLDRTEIINVTNNNANILKQLDEQIDLLNGGAIRSIKKSVPANSTVDFFSLTSSGKSFSIILQTVSDTVDFYVAKIIEVTFTNGDVGMFSKDSKITNANDYELIVNPIDGGVKFSIINLSSMLETEINMVLTIAPSTNMATFTTL